MIHISAINVRRVLGIAFSAVAVLILVGQSSMVYALTAEQQKAFQKQVLYFNTELCASTAVGVGIDTSNLKGSDNAEKSFNYFVGTAKYPPEIAAAITGNFQVESSFDPTVVNSIGAMGLGQWYQGRRSNLNAFAAQKGGKPTDLVIQLAFTVHELETGYKRVMDEMKADMSKSDAVAAAASDFDYDFEAPATRAQGDPSLPKRIGYAKKFMQLYGGTAAASDGTAGDSDDSDDTSTSNVSCANGGTSDIGTGKGKFTDNTTKTYPGVDDMIARAKKVSDLQGSYFNQICSGSSHCYRMCSYLMARIWGKGSSGKSYAVGTNASNGLWYYLLSTGHGHANDRSVPVGALLFYKTGSVAGHVAIYLGNNKVLSNDVLDSSSHITGGAYITDASAMESGPWRLTYLGWADPAYPT